MHYMRIDFSYLLQKFVTGDWMWSTILEAAYPNYANELKTSTMEWLEQFNENNKYSYYSGLFIK